MSVKGNHLRYIAVLTLGCCALALAQDNQPPTFRSGVDLVLVPVVVRDRHRRAVGHLTKDDFQLFDNGKPQTIASFTTVERPRGARESGGKAAVAPAGAGRSGAAAGAAAGGERYFIYLFDDVNTRFADMANMRAAAVSHFQKSFAAGDHAAIETMSGRDASEFTGDREKLGEAASKLRWGRVVGSGGMGCPDVSYYIADLIAMKNDVEALAGLTSHVVDCAHVRPEVARNIAMAAANREVMIGARTTQLALTALRRAIRRLSGMPGQRVIVLASPGFYAQASEGIKGTTELLELAAKNEVIINGLSARGLIQAEEEEDVAGKRGVGRRAVPRATAPDQAWIRYRRESAMADGDVMNDLAQGTGGVFFHNNNNLFGGFEQVAAAPEFSYVLGFSPAELKTDGAFHALRVRVPNGKGASIEARRGYYALKPEPKDRQAATAALEDAIFSRNEQGELPVVLQTGYSRAKDAAVVTVLLTARIELATVRDALDIAVALFDRDGSYVTGTAEAVKFGAPGLTGRDGTLHWEFPEIPAGSYRVRLVVREPKGKAITTVNRELLVK